MPLPDRTDHLRTGLLHQSHADSLRAAIYAGTMGPGELLLDADLMAWLDVSSSLLATVLDDLEQAGLVARLSAGVVQVSLPQASERTAVLQTVGTLMGGVVRLTVPVLDAGPRMELVAFVEHAMSAVARRDADGHTRSMWGLTNQLLRHCGNRVLVSTTQQALEPLVHRLSIMPELNATDWGDLHVGYPHLRDAIASGDAVRAELALEHVFRLQAAP